MLIPHPRQGLPRSFDRRRLPGRRHFHGRRGRGLPGGPRLWWAGGWLAAAAWAGASALFSSLGPHRSWGSIACAAYLAAAVALVLPERRASARAAAVALGGAVVLPLFVLIAAGQGQSEVDVIERSGDLLLRHGTPYLADPQSVAEYNPYLPGMALFGLPHALLGTDGWPARLLGDSRLWCAAVFLGCLRAAAARTTRPLSSGSRPGAPLLMAALVASPLLRCRCASAGSTCR
ncbi:hypothetical protein ACF9IK_28950 [Kitasatospora hibisci]|uniref:hypothetical protein n=1 Tax=Kitasatospora hibisci TaxID=3369522 RepID=UPI0037546742